MPQHFERKEDMIHMFMLTFSSPFVVYFIACVIILTKLCVSATYLPRRTLYIKTLRARAILKEEHWMGGQMDITMIAIKDYHT